MKRQELLWLTSTLGTFMVLSVLIAISMVSPGVMGEINGTTITKVWVWNTEPNITGVTVGPSTITLIPGNTTRINCTAIVWDWNGYADVNVTNATFYHNTVTATDPDDNNNHYTIEDINTNCTCVQNGASATNASCYCFFDIWYYANNGTWTCNMTIKDMGGNATEREYMFNDSATGNATINTLIGMDVVSLVDYGNLSVTETSTEKEINITNFGNEDINISVRGYGGTNDTKRNNPTNSSFICELGNMHLGQERYAVSTGVDWTVMTNLTNTSTLIQNFTLPQRTNDTDYGNDKNQTYWKLKVPLTVAGYCNGTLEFTAFDANG